MNTPIEKFCKKHQRNTKHRWSNVPDQVNGGYYLCAECTEENSKRHRKRHWLRYLAQKANARKRPNSERMAEALLQEIWNRQDGRCFITGKSFEEQGDWAASLDRINANKGYTKDNVMLTAWIVNHSRGDLEFDRFVQMCKLVVDGVMERSILG